MARNGLRLRAELIAKPIEPPSGQKSLATVWVDSGVYHLDGEYSYLVPGNLNDFVKVGSFVLVPFNGRELSALVIARGALDGHANLKSILSCEGSIPLVTKEQIELIKVLARKNLAHPFDLIRSIVPPRLSSIEKLRSPQVIPEVMKRSRTKGIQYLQLPPHRRRDLLIAKKLSELLESGPTLAVFPDVREVESISRQLDLMNISYTRYDSSQSRSEHYSSYLDVVQGISRLVIGTRSSIFAPVMALQNIVVFNEGSEHYYEKRSPGWCARDVAFERSINESISLNFVGYTPSLEIAKKISNGEINFRRQNQRLQVNEFSQPFGELLPSGALSLIRKSLVDGPVLFITPSKGWAHAIRCTRCKTLSKCICGGSFEIKSEKSSVTCNHCGAINSKWKCTWCENSTFSLVGRGMERHGHEIGKLFPGILIKSASADNPNIDEISEGIVIATQGMPPIATEGYSAVVILEGNRLLNQPDMRAQERMREIYFSHGALVRTGGKIILIQDEGNSVSTALRMWNPMPTLESELSERFDLNLPPFTHTVELTMAKDEVVRFKSAVIKARDDGRLPLDMKILGPIIKGENSSIVLTSETTRSDEVNILIHEFMRRRSAAKKALPSLRINPYSLSR